MKIALITDTHFGARSDHLAFDAYFKKFYDEFFFPTLVEKGITTVMHLGDVFDRRKYINYNTLKSCKQYFFDQQVRSSLCYACLGNKKHVLRHYET